MLKLKKQILALALATILTTIIPFNNIANASSVGNMESDDFTIDCIDDETVVDLLKEEVDEDIVDKVLEDIEIMDNLGMESGLVIDIDVQKDTIVYKLEICEGVITTMEIDADNKNGDISLAIEEGKSHDEITITDDGKLFLDGNEVIVETAETVEDETEIIASAGTDRYAVTSAPGSTKAADWSVYKRTISTADIRTAKALGLMTRTAIGLIISNFFPLYGLAYTIGSLVYSLATLYSPNSTHISCKEKVYYHKTRGQLTYKAGLYAEKRIGTYYAQANYKGNSKSQTYYACTQYY